MCISRVSNRRVGTKDLAATADDIISDSLKNGRVFGHSNLLVYRTAATVHPPYWQNGGSPPPDLTATDWLLVPANAKAGSAARCPTESSISRRGDHRTHAASSLQPSLAVCVRRRCPNRGVATGRYLPTRDLLPVLAQPHNSYIVLWTGKE